MIYYLYTNFGKIFNKNIYYKILKKKIYLMTRNFFSHSRKKNIKPLNNKNVKSLSNKKNS